MKAKRPTVSKRQALRAFREVLLGELRQSASANPPRGRRASDEHQARRIESAFVEAIRWALEGATAVSIPGLGTFRKASRKARRIVSVCWDGSPGRDMRLPDMPEIRFRPSKSWKESLR